MAFGVYVHVPWCQTVCGYCDFNTYVPGRVEGATPSTYADTAIAEIALMHAEIGDRRAGHRLLRRRHPDRCSSPMRSRRIVAALRPVPGAELTIEANPDTVDEERLAALRAIGFTRLSIGMQSASANVLATLERTHTPGAAAAAARAARAAGFEHVGLDLIFGTPGETDDDWRATLAAALDAEPDHVAAYALTVEPGTRLAAHVRAGRLPAPDEDDLARRYELTDATLTAAGLPWYEVSNWARTPAARCHHNLNYWAGGDWWAIGPGAHGHMDGDALLDAPPSRDTRPGGRARGAADRGARDARRRSARARASDARDPHPRGCRIARPGCRRATARARRHHRRPCRAHAAGSAACGRGDAGAGVATRGAAR